MEWIKKHVDTVVVLGGIVGSLLWMNHQFTKINERFSDLEKEMAVVKTVLIMQGHMPKELAVTKENK